MAKQTIYAPYEAGYTAAENSFYLYQKWASAPSQHLLATGNMTKTSDRAQVVWPVITATVWKAASDGSGNVVYSYKDLAGGTFAINQIVMVVGCKTAGFNTNNQVLVATRGWGAAITAVTTSSATEGTFTIVNAQTGTEYEPNMVNVSCAAMVGPSCVITSVTGVTTTATYSYSSISGTLHNGQTIIITGFATAAYNQVGEIFNLTGSTFQLTITSTSSTQTPTNGYGTVAVDGLIPTNTALTGDLGGHLPAVITAYAGDGVTATFTSATHGLVAGQTVQITGLPLNATAITGGSSTGSAMTVTGGWASGGSNAYVGMWFNTSGYGTVDTNNNGGPFICTASSAGSITLTNPFSPTSGHAGSPLITIVNGGFNGIFKVLSVPSANTFTAQSTTSSSTVSGLTGTGVLIHYEMWTPSDGGTNFYLKMEFGGYCSTTFTVFDPAFAVTLGTVDTNGILSTQTVREVIGYDGHGFTTPTLGTRKQNYACDFYSNGSAFAMMMFRDGQTQSSGVASGMAFGWERSKNSSGTYTNDYVAYMVVANLATSLLQSQSALFLSANPGQGATVQAPRQLIVCIASAAGSTMSGYSTGGWGDSVVSPIYPNVGYIGNPLTIFVTGTSGFSTSTPGFSHNPEGLLKKVKIAGQEHTYLFSTNGMFGALTSANGFFLGMRYE